MAVILIRATIEDGGDLRSWRYAVNEIGELDAKETLRRYLSDKGLRCEGMEIFQATRGMLASLTKLPLGDVRILH